MINSDALIDGISDILSNYPFFDNFSQPPTSTESAFLKHISPVSYQHFFKNCLLPNKPCIFGSWLTENWKSRGEWVTDGVADFTFLVEKFGNAEIPVADCSKSEYGSQPKQTWSMKKFAEYWMQVNKSDSSSSDIRYLKDWHFTSDFPHYEAYSTPLYFTSDWLNEACDEKCFQCEEDFRFVYMGPKGSWTPFHADVYRSYSWSANVCGRKKWFFCLPGREDKLRDKFGNLPYDVRDLDKTQRKDFIEVIQEAGEVIFVPSGWHHQVHNMEDTISINHNWINGCNLMNVWKFLQEELAAVEKEIDDCRSSMTPDEWRDQCQMLMKVNTGMNFSDFLNFLYTISQPRIKKMQQTLQLIQFPKHNIYVGPTAAEVNLHESRTTLCRLRELIASQKREFDGRFKELNHTLFDLCSVVPVTISFSRRLDKTSDSNEKILFQLSFDVLRVLDEFCARAERKFVN